MNHAEKSAVPAYTPFLEQRLKLTLKDETTLLAPTSEGLPFLGFRIYPGLIRLNQRTRQRLRRKLAALEEGYYAGWIDEVMIQR